MSRIRVALAALIMMTLPSLLHAQVRRDTARTRRNADSSWMDGRSSAFMQNQIEMMEPMMGQMMTTMVSSMLDALAKPENTQRMATFTKNYFDALMGKGFTRDEAFR